MPKADAIAAALFAAIPAPGGAVRLRGGALPEAIPAAGLINLIEGDAVEEIERLGGQREMLVEHEIEIAVARADDAARAGALATLAGAIATAVLADAPLAALVDHVRVEPLRDRQTLAQPGAETLATATLPVAIQYRTGPNPQE